LTNKPVPSDSYPYESENFPVAFFVVWLLVRAVTGGASDGYGKTNNRSSEHLARTKEPEAKQEILHIFDYLLINHANAPLLLFQRGIYSKKSVLYLL